jgi:Fe(3+) dicitrate transport protein
MRKFQLLMMMCLMCVASYAQYNINGSIRRGDEPVVHAVVILQPGSQQKLSDENGFFRFTKLTPGAYTIKIGEYEETIVITDKHISADINLLKHITLSDVVVTGKRNESVSGMLKDVSGTTINAGKKTEVINMRHINANLATNNTRQIYARIPGLNIWEYDRGGLQLGIGGRGLSPNRSSNFNIRQNGYDISADALGYPESYYTPSSEAIERIEIVRGAASLQYGPQFGGLVNFIMKEGPKAKPFELTTRQTLGSYGFFNSFNSVGGTIAKNKLNYYAFYQFKRGDDWRPNSHYDQHNAYVHLAYDVSPKFKITGEYTLMKYLAQQPGGLTDAQFKEDPSVSVRARNWFKVDWNLVSLNMDYAFNEHTRLNWP